MAISKSSSKQPWPDSPFRSTKLNSVLTVMSILTLIVSILVTGYVKFPKESCETRATGLWASALAVMLLFSRRKCSARVEGMQIIPRHRNANVCKPLLLLAVSARSIRPPARCSARARHYPVVGVDMLSVQRSSRCPQDGSPHSRLNGNPGHPTRRSALADQSFRRSRLPVNGQPRCRGVQSSSGALPLPQFWPLS